MNTLRRTSELALVHQLPQLAAALGGCATRPRGENPALAVTSNTISPENVMLCPYCPSPPPSQTVIGMASMFLGAK